MFKTIMPLDFCYRIRIGHEIFDSDLLNSFNFAIFVGLSMVQRSS